MIKQRLIAVLNRIWRLLAEIDGIWSVPLIFLAFWLFGFLTQAYFGAASGTYDPAFFQPAILAVGIVVIATNATVWGLWFTFRAIYKYFYGSSTTHNLSVKDFNELKGWQRLLISFGLFFFYVSAILFVYIRLV